MEWFQQLKDWAITNDNLLWAIFASSLVLVLVTPLIVGWIVLSLPPDYFTRKHRGQSHARQKHAWWPAVVIAKNIVGAVLMLAGLLMLVMPGQGLLTLAVGLLLVDFPGKFRLERWLVTRPPVWRSINWMRKRAGREPLKQPGQDAQK